MRWSKSWRVCFAALRPAGATAGMMRSPTSWRVCVAALRPAGTATGTIRVPTSWRAAPTRAATISVIFAVVTGMRTSVGAAPNKLGSASRASAVLQLRWCSVCHPHPAGSVIQARGWFVSTVRRDGVRCRVGR